MSGLNLKVPPPVVWIISAFFMWLLDVFFPTMNEPELRFLIAPILAFIGIAFIVFGVLSFKKAETTIDPTTPEKSSSLVIVGIYKFTRNPMYMGLLFFLCSWSVFLFNLYSAFILIAFVLYLTEFQIKPEEEILTSIFGEEYIRYKNSVRRWI